MIAIENLTKSYGGQVLFNQTGFKINAKERIGLVGRNGHGKTTLFRMLTGQEDYDAGAVVIPRNYRVGYVRQHLDFTEKTVLNEGIQGLAQTEKDQHWKVKKILAGLGFSEADMQRPPTDFSGGFQVRLNLAKALVYEPDLLLLDEPTNYLDITSIRWIERFLVNWPHELMLITHDRGFMDRIVTHIIGIHRQKIRKITGNTEKYYIQLAQDEEIYEKTRLNAERRAREIEHFITRFRAKARLAGLVQSRVKTLAKLEKKDRIEKLRTLDFAFRSLAFCGKQILNVQGLSFAYSGGPPLFQDLNISIHAGERICIVGPNGKGKTTLLKLMAGHLKPQGGEIYYHPKTVSGCYEQTNVQTLNDNHTVVEEILFSHPDVDHQTARNLCGAMLFEGDAALKKIAVLSGGEKSRVMLGKILATPVNLLLLDEPSNHLDMESCDALLAAIDDFSGTVIMVTHNEMFLHALAQRLIVFTGDDITVFEGTYQDFLDKEGWGDETSGQFINQSMAKVKKTDTQLSKKELRRLRSTLINERSCRLKPVNKAIVAAEQALEKKEVQLAQLNQDMVSASQDQDGERIAALSVQLRQCQAFIDEHLNQLEDLYQQKEAAEAEFEQRLAQLEISPS